MRILFIGSVRFSASMLEVLLAHEGAEIVGIATKRGAGYNSDYVDIGIYSARAGCPVYYDSGDWIEMKNFIMACRPDVVYCFGWSRLLPVDLLTLAERGVVGYHPAALPENRGRHPIIWTLTLGLEWTASTFFLMDGGADSGPIISQVPVKISPSDDAGSLYDKLETVAAKQLQELTDDIIADRVVLRSQDQSKASYWRKRNKSDGVIDWRMSADSIMNLVRALRRPYPGATYYLDGAAQAVEKVCIERKLFASNIEPGKVLAREGLAFLVKCGDGAVWVLDHSSIRAPEVGEYI